MAFISSAIRTLNGFDPALGGGGPSNTGQDTDSFFRAILHGYTAVYTPSAMIYHQHFREFSRLCRQLFNYGVGETAHMMKVICTYPRMALGFALNVPVGVFRLLYSSSEKNHGKSVHYPRELVRMERKGLFYGPLAYLQTLCYLRRLESRQPVSIRPSLLARPEGAAERK
jgi:hypothetical protein